MSPASKYWFQVERYGWGWGLPISWQGWGALAVFVALIIAGALVFMPRCDTTAYVIYVVVISLGLVVVCWLKGEEPYWRSGADEP
jgi:hypothetical protein